MIQLCESKERVADYIAMFDDLSKKTDELIKMDDDYTLRLVNSRNNLREKVYIFDQGLDDRIIELMKLFIRFDISQENPEHEVDEIFLEIRDDVIRMVAGEEIDIIINEEFRAGQGTPKTKEEIYSAMIVLGFLSYNDGYLKIPNKELMIEFEKALRDKSFGYVSEIIENSRIMLKATVNKDTTAVEKILHDIHNSEIPILQYNDENSLSCVITLAYLSARDTYRVEREEKTGKGYADFTFHPRRKNDTAFIVELKKDEVPEVAINQIREKEYIQKFKAENEGKEVLAVAICYDSKKKEHYCKIEEI